MKPNVSDSKCSRRFGSCRALRKRIHYSDNNKIRHVMCRHSTSSRMEAISHFAFHFSQAISMFSVPQHGINLLSKSMLTFHIPFKPLTTLFRAIFVTVDCFYFHEFFYWVFFCFFLISFLWRQIGIDVAISWACVT